MDRENLSEILAMKSGSLRPRSSARPSIDEAVQSVQVRFRRRDDDVVIGTAPYEDRSVFGGHAHRDLADGVTTARDGLDGELG